MVNKLNTEPEKYWFNTKTGEVEKGRQAMAMDRVGPFDTEAEAVQALEKLQQRSEAWEAEEASEENWN